MICYDWFLTDFIAQQYLFKMIYKLNIIYNFEVWCFVLVQWVRIYRTVFSVEQVQIMFMFYVIEISVKLGEYSVNLIETTFTD